MRHEAQPSRSNTWNPVRSICPDFLARIYIIFPFPFPCPNPTPKPHTSPLLNRRKRKPRLYSPTRLDCTVTSNVLVTPPHHERIYHLSHCLRNSKLLLLLLRFQCVSPPAPKPFQISHLPSMPSIHYPLNPSVSLFFRFFSSSSHPMLYLQDHRLRPQP